MNKREQARKQAQVMLAYADGAEIECRGTAANSWFDIEPDWNWVGAVYRVKQTGSDRVRELLKSGKPVAASVTDNSQQDADHRATHFKSVVVVCANNGLFRTSTGTHWKYSSPVDLSQFAQETEDE